MSDKSVLEYAEGMADALGDGTWKTWTQEQAHEVEEVLDSLRAMVRDYGARVVRAEKVVRLMEEFRRCGEQPTLDPGGSGEYRRLRRKMEEAHREALAALTGEDVQPGDPIASCSCPCCGASLTIEHGDDEGEVSVVGTPSKEGADNIALNYEEACESERILLGQVREMSARLARVREAVECAGLRWSEWGDRATTVAEMLDAALDGAMEEEENHE